MNRRALEKKEKGREARRGMAKGRAWVYTTRVPRRAHKSGSFERVYKHLGIIPGIALFERDIFRKAIRIRAR